MTNDEADFHAEKLSETAAQMIADGVEPMLVVDAFLSVAIFVHMNTKGKAAAARHLHALSLGLAEQTPQQAH